MRFAGAVAATQQVELLVVGCVEAPADALHRRAVAFGGAIHRHALGVFLLLAESAAQLDIVRVAAADFDDFSNFGHKLVG